MSFIDQHHDTSSEKPDWEVERSSAESEAVDPVDDADRGMASPDDADLDDADADADSTDGEVQSTHALFDGDAGGLELEERRAMVVLLKNRFITSESNPREWRATVKSRRIIGERLNDLFLELVVNTEREVAYKRPATGGGEFPTLLHDTAWQREETALLVYLRVRSRSEQSRGEAHARVSYAELAEYLQENRPDSATNRVADDRRTNRAIGSLKTAGILVKTDEDGVFKVSPAIEPMLPVPVLNDLLTWLKVRTAAGPDDAALTDVEQTQAVPTDAASTEEESA